MTHSQHNVFVDVYTGSQGSLLVSTMWAAMDDKAKDALLWDVPAAFRKHLLSQALQDAYSVGIGWVGDDLAAFAWITPVVRGSHCHMIHCCFFGAGRKHAVEISRLFLSKLRGRDGVRSLLALVPVGYRHIRSMACEAGFAEMGKLQGVCVMARRSKPVDGVLMSYEVGA